MDDVQPAAASQAAGASTSTAAASAQLQLQQNPPAKVQRIKEIRPLAPFKPDLFQRGWSSVPHPTLPLLATAHNKSVTLFSLATFSAHSALTGGHSRSVRSVAWKPGLPPHKLCLVTGSFDSTAGLWRYEQKGEGGGAVLETEMTAARVQRNAGDGDEDEADEADDDDAWEFTLVLEGQEHEIKSVAFAPAGNLLATCSRDKSVWIWEDVGAQDDDDEWETVAVLNEHEGDVKCVSWCPDVPGRRSGDPRGRRYGLDVLASSSYDNTVRLWREDADGEWVCVAVLEGHSGTVWGVQWEADPARTRFPRLLTWSADQTLRVWSLHEEEDDEQSERAQEGGGSSSLLSRGIPNTMRQSLREDWVCTAVLPQAHTRDIYSAAWSAATGLVASTGSDGTVVVYAEFDGPGEGGAGEKQNTSEKEAAAALDGDVHMANGHIPAANGHSHDHGHDHSQNNGKGNRTAGTGPATHWRVAGNVVGAHGPYEVNNITWCRRFDPGTERRGEEEMLVTTGDDGVVRPWQIVT